MCSAYNGRLQQDRPLGPSPRTLPNAVCVRVLQVLFNFAAGKFSPGAKYTFVAYASNAAGEGPPSKPVTFTPRVPGPPTIDVVGLVSGSLSLDVSPPSDTGSSGLLGTAFSLWMHASLLQVC